MNKFWIVCRDDNGLYATTRYNSFEEARKGAIERLMGSTGKETLLIFELRGGLRELSDQVEWLEVE